LFCVQNNSRFSSGRLPSQFSNYVARLNAAEQHLSPRSRAKKPPVINQKRFRLHRTVSRACLLGRMTFSRPSGSHSLKLFRIAEQNRRGHTSRFPTVYRRSNFTRSCGSRRLGVLILILRISECHHCGSPSIYSSRFKRTDMRAIFFLARPFRCGQCWERFYDFVWKKATLPHPTAADLHDLAPFEEPIHP
jgi:hypothetical protein